MLMFFSGLTIFDVNAGFTQGKNIWEVNPAPFFPYVSKSPPSMCTEKQEIPPLNKGVEHCQRFGLVTSNKKRQETTYF